MADGKDVNVEELYEEFKKTQKGFLSSVRQDLKELPFNDQSEEDALHTAMVNCLESDALKKAVNPKAYLITCIKHLVSKLKREAIRSFEKYHNLERIDENNSEGKPVISLKSPYPGTLFLLETAQELKRVLAALTPGERELYVLVCRQKVGKNYLLKYYEKELEPDDLTTITPEGLKKYWARLRKRIERLRQKIKDVRAMGFGDAKPGSDDIDMKEK